MLHRLILFILILSAILIIVPSALAQDLPADIIPTAVDAANAAIPGLGQPNEWRWSFVPNVRDSALGCPLVTGTPLDTPVTVYQVTLIYGIESYNVFVSVDTTRVQLCDSKFPGLGLAATNTPSPTPTGPTPTPGACVLSPTGAFANVRGVPSLDGTQVDTITENTTHAVLGRNSESTWYLIEQGWVSSTVIVLSGDCRAVPSVSGSQSIGGTATPAPPDSDIVLPFVCLTDSDLYLPTRIQAGQGTAQVEAGGLPNRLRAEPATSGAFIMDIQPGRTLDRVISGPACNEGYVWWEVEIDGQRGWTAESNGNTSEYYITPVEGFEVLPGRVLRGAEGSINSIAFAPEAEALVASDSTGDSLLAWDLSTDELVTPSLDHGAPIIGVTYLPDGTLATSGMDGRVRLWQSDGTQFEPLEGVIDPKWGARIGISPDGLLLAAPGCAEPGQLQDCILGQSRIYDINSGEVVMTIQGHSNAIHSVMFSPDGTLVATSSTDGVWLWDAETGEQVRVLPSQEFINGIAFHPDGVMLAAASCTEPLIQNNIRTCNLGEVRLWDVETGTALAVLAHPDEVQSVAFSPDGSRLASGDTDGVVYLWDVEAEAEIAMLVGHVQRVLALAFNADGDLLASGSIDQTIRLWELETE